MRSLATGRIYESLAALPAGMVIPAEIAAQLTYSAPEQRLYWAGPMTAEQEKLLLTLNTGAAWQTAIAGIIQRMRDEIITNSILRLKNRLLGSQNQLRTAVQRYENLLDGATWRSRSTTRLGMKSAPWPRP